MQEQKEAGLCASITAQHAVLAARANKQQQQFSDAGCFGYSAAAVLDFASDLWMTVEIAVYVPLVCPARLFLMINSANTIDVNALLSSSTKRVHYKLLASLLWGEGGLLVKFQTLEFEAFLVLTYRLISFATLRFRF